MSRGRVIFVSRNGGMLVVQHDDGFTLVEMLGDEGEVGVGDVLSGDWTAVAGETMQGNGAEYDAYFQGCWGAPAIPVQMARQMGGG